jgi:hypothetical protein
MARTWWIAWLAATALGAAGCVNGPLPNNPQLVRSNAWAVAENPLFVPQGVDDSAYQMVFDRSYSVLNEYFDIAYANRFGGKIQGLPLTSAGYFDAPRMRFYNNYELLESTLQTIQRNASIQIFPADSGGYYVEVIVEKYLADFPQPQHGGGGIAVFHAENPVERQYDVVGMGQPSRRWFLIGRDHALEAAILARLKECL